LGEKLMPSWNVQNPYGGDLATYEEAVAEIQKHVEELSSVLKKS
jgi:protein-tyrosine-phosphatase